ncbi:hypothetical protein DRJ27_04910, partial [Candidatus Acetothermia bacterium]
LLQLSELPGEVRRNEVRPKAQDLAQFHKGRAQLLQGQAKPLAPTELRPYPWTRKLDKGIVGGKYTDEFAETVLGKDGGDRA